MSANKAVVIDKVAQYAITWLLNRVKYKNDTHAADKPYEPSEPIIDVFFHKISFALN